MNKNKGFTKSIAFTLVLAMLFATLSFGAMAGLPGVPGAGGAEAYGAESVTATVRIEGPDGETILPETEGAIADGVTTIGGFVAEICSDAGIDFQLSGGFPSTIGAITGMWTSKIDDSGNAFNSGNFSNIKLKNGDQVVLCSYQNGVDYASFEIGESGKEIIEGSTTATRAFTLLKYSYDKDWNIVQSVVKNATLTVKKISDETTFSAITNSSGQAIVSFKEGEYEIYIETDQLLQLKITKPYARILVDSELNSSVKSPILKEVGIEKFEVEIGDGQLYDMKSRIEAWNADINTSQSVMGITVTAIPISGDANISISPGGVLVSGEPTYIEVGALVGSNGIDVTVRNDRFSQKYSFYINIVPPSVDNDSLTVEINSVINGTLGLGISNYSSNYSEYVMSLEKNGTELSSSEKEAFLEAIMRDASSESIGKLGKIAAALSVIGIDPREVPDVSEDAPEGQTIDILELMSQKKIEELDAGGAPYALPYVLLAFDSGVYSTTGKISRTELIDYLLSQQASSGGFPNSYTDVDTTAIYLIALSPYYKALGPLNGVDQVRIDKIKNAVNKSLLYILQNQAEFGRYAYMGASSSNTTSMVIAALSSLGIDPHASPYISDNYSAVQGLLSFKTADNLIAIKDSQAPNELSNIQGAMALASYKRYISGKNPNLFVSEKTITVYDQWPTEILKEISVQRKNIEYKAGETIASTNLTVTAIFSSQGGIRTEVIPYNEDGIAGYAIAGGSPFVAGGNNITISFRGKSFMFIQNALNADGTAPQIKTVGLTVKDENNRTIASQGNAPIQPGVTSVIDALIMTLNEANVPYTIPGGTYVSSINGLGEFDLGPYSGWLYQVDGNTPSTTGADQYKLTGGERVTWYYTKDFTKDASSSAWVAENQAGAVQDGLVSVTTDVKAVTGSDGTAKATVSTTQLDTAVTDALKAAAASKDDAKPAITIAIEADSKAQGVETVIPKASFANLVNKGIQQMTIASPLGNMTLDLETLKDIIKGGAGDISLSIKKAEESQGRPVIRLEINNGGKTVGAFSKPITIAVPYTPATGEAEQGIAVFHLDENGQWKNIKASKYDNKNKAITFRTDHFSDFVIAYSYKTFGDIKGHWAQTPIEYLASRRIIQGMTEESFAPNGTITRAQFVTLLAGMAGADLSQYSLSQFNDVKDKAWYKGAVAWSAENGIVQGQQAADGSFWFNPNQNISRQDMAVVMMRYLAWAKEPVAETTKAITFKDGSSIAAYAKESVTTMQKAGLINGRTTPDNQTIFDPAGKLTRAEAAQILTNQLYKQF